MEKSIQKQIQGLTIYAIVSSILILGLIGVVFIREQHPTRFTEIDVERINVHEKDGTLKMVISNAARQHPGSIDGKPIPARERPAGLIFFNASGDECGGLVYEGGRKAANLTFSVDQYKNDQIMQLQYDDVIAGSQHTKTYGLRLWDRPETFTLGQLERQIDSLRKLKSDLKMEQGIADMKAKGLVGYERLFVGKNRNNETGLFIQDESGKPRIQLYVDKKGKTVIDLLDESGRKIALP